MTNILTIEQTGCVCVLVWVFVCLYVCACVLVWGKHIIFLSLASHELQIKLAWI